MTCYVWSHCCGGGKPYLSHNFSGTRNECKKFIRARGNHGFYFITTISDPNKVRKRYGN